MNAPDVLEPDAGTPAWHALPVADVVERLCARPGEGFDSVEATFLVVEAEKLAIRLQRRWRQSGAA